MDLRPTIVTPLPGFPRHARASWADLGWSRMTLLLVGINALTLVLAVVLFRASGFQLGIDNKEQWADVLVLILASAIWIYYAWLPGPPGDWIIPQTAMVFILLQLAGILNAPTQYAAAALNRPTIDPLLASADRLLGISVPALTAWTAGHPWFVALLKWAYFTFIYQLFLPVFALPWWGESEPLWEFAFHMLVCGLVTVTVFALWPAACVFSELHFQPLLNQSRFLAHFAAARDGSMTTVPWGNIEGLVSVPSFHAAGAVLVTWACRRTWLVWVLVPINVLLVAATVLLGAHYVVDLFASACLLAGSLTVYRWTVRQPWMARRA